MERQEQKVLLKLYNIKVEKALKALNVFSSLCIISHSPALLEQFSSTLYCITWCCSLKFSYKFFQFRFFARNIIKIDHEIINKLTGSSSYLGKLWFFVYIGKIIWVQKNYFSYLLKNDNFWKKEKNIIFRHSGIYAIAAIKYINNYEWSPFFCWPT